MALRGTRDQSDRAVPASRERAVFERGQDSVEESLLVVGGAFFFKEVPRAESAKGWIRGAEPSIYRRFGTQFPGDTTVAELRPQGGNNPLADVNRLDLRGGRIWRVRGRWSGSGRIDGCTEQRDYAGTCWHADHSSARMRHVKRFKRLRGLSTFRIVAPKGKAVV